MKKWLLILSLISIEAIGQNDENKGFVVLRDSARYIQGEVFFDPWIPDVIGFRQFEKGSIKKLKASEVLEWGINKESYSSEFIDDEYLFLKKEVTGANELLILRDKAEGNAKFFTKVDSSLNQLDSKTYKDQLSSLMYNKKFGAEIIDETHFSERSLTRAIIYSNSSTYFFPRVRYGLNLGINSVILNLESQGSGSIVNGQVVIDRQIDFPRSIGLVLGAFVDIPIEVFSSFSAHTELNFSRINYRKSDLKVSSFNIPLLLRYRLKTLYNPTFFINSGPTLTLNKVLKNSGSYIENTYPSKMGGFAIGLGAEYSSSYGKDLDFELRYSYKSDSDDLLNSTKSLQIICSFNF